MQNYLKPCSFAPMLHMVCLLTMVSNYYSVVVVVTVMNLILVDAQYYMLKYYFNIYIFMLK